MCHPVMSSRVGVCQNNKKKQKKKDDTVLCLSGVSDTCQVSMSDIDTIQNAVSTPHRFDPFWHLKTNKRKQSSLVFLILSILHEVVM